MRMSCNGCRVLRKGCSENCSIRPCLQWIKNPDSQANATVFLAKFYGRAGLMNLINAGPENLRPAIFRSLLYEACGRVVNPIYGSVGLLWSGSWQLCQAAVEAVLKGAPIMQIPSETAANTPVPPLKAYDIRHVSKEDGGAGASSADRDLHKASKTTRTRFKRSAANRNNNRGGGRDDGGKLKPNVGSSDATPIDPDYSAQACNLSWPRCHPVDFHRAPSHESSASQASDPVFAADGDGDASHATPASTGAAGYGDSRENERIFSVETVEASWVTSQAQPPKNDGGAEDSKVELELTLGFEPVSNATGSCVAARRAVENPKRRETVMNLWSLDTCRVDLGLDLPALVHMGHSTTAAGGHLR